MFSQIRLVWRCALQRGCAVRTATELVMAFDIFVRSRHAAAFVLPMPLNWRRKHSARALRQHRTRAVGEPSALLLATKRVIDIVGSSLGLLFFAPLFIA